ncbi:ComEC/Rec2 family competence protein [Winogradskyella sp. A3E31]|uniref:ComEC/Rec2 family competence protein n=1 Tax=Winogradskyella sp. A3E31 TaxID=3349637 RepID=UPI00398B4058
MKLLNFSVIKLTLCLIIGILIGHYLSPSLLFTVLSLVILFVCLSVVFIYNSFKTNQNPWFGILAFLSMIFIGVLIFQLQDERLSTNHYIHSKTDLASSNALIFKIRKKLKPDAYNYKFIAEVVSINHKPHSGQLLLNISKDSSDLDFGVDDLFFTSASLTEVQRPKNPYQFNYNNYLQQRQVYHQTYLRPSELFQLDSEKTSIYGYADEFRSKVNRKLKASGFEKESLSIINALLLGQRQDIDATIYNNYVNAGTIHILAVSGLHVGIILLILQFILKPLLYVKQGRTLQIIIIVIALWSFAIIAGLSPSVTRAVTMFSVIAIAMQLKRPTNIYNTLTISAFIILLFKPIYVFDVGFQMSYLAVLAIVSFQPIFYKLWQPKLWAIDKLWQIFTVTLAAQIGVVPISLYYFHQFPGLFFISNLVIIPFLGLILSTGILIIALALLNSLPKFLVDTFSFIIESLNAFIAWIAQFENFLLRDIPISLLQVLASYLGIATLLWVIKQKSFRALTLFLTSIILFLGASTWNSFTTSNSEVIVFNKSRHTIIGQKSGTSLKTYSTLPDSMLHIDNSVKNYKVGAFISEIENDTLTSVYQFNGNKVLVVDSLGVYMVNSFQPDVVLLRESPKVNLNRLIDHIQPKLIIADASNYKTYVARWKATCLNKKIPFHYTNEKGFYKLNL